MKTLLFALKSSSVVIVLSFMCSCGDNLTKRLPYESLIQPDQIAGSELIVSSEKFPGLLQPHVSLTFKSFTRDIPRKITGRLNCETSQGKADSLELPLQLTQSYISERDQIPLEVYDVRLLENYNEPGRYKSWDFTIALNEDSQKELVQIRVHGWTTNRNLE